MYTHVGVTGACGCEVRKGDDGLVVCALQVFVGVRQGAEGNDMGVTSVGRVKARCGMYQ